MQQKMVQRCLWDVHVAGFQKQMVDKAQIKHTIEIYEMPEGRLKELLRFCAEEYEKELRCRRENL